MKKTFSLTLLLLGSLLLSACIYEDPEPRRKRVPNSQWRAVERPDSYSRADDNNY